MGYFLGIDVGTGSTRSLIINERGETLGSATREYPLHTPRPLWSEQDPEDWWKAVQESLPVACRAAGIQPNQISAIGLSGQMHGAVFLDEHGEVIRRAILWNDQRTAAECAEITARAGKEAVERITLNPVLTGFQAPKIVWLKNNEPDAFRRVCKVLLPKDYIRYLLTGAWATEVSDASGTSLLNVVKRKWSPEMMGAAYVEDSWLPECFESIEVSAHVSAEAARLLGLKEGTPVVGGGGDNAAGAIGNGIVEPGLVTSSLGTSGVVFAHADEPIVDPQLRTHTFCHTVPGKWHVMGVVISAGGALRWYRDTLCQEEKRLAEEQGQDAYDVMTSSAESIVPGADGLFFLPYLSGERTPYPDPYARGVFFGATLAHTKGHFTKAVLEGVGFALKDSFDILQAMGVDTSEVRVTGGGARSPLWRQILADIVGQRHVKLNVDEGPALGAAVLAAVSQGAWSSVQEAGRAIIQRTDENLPNEDNARQYGRLHEFYSSLYATLKERFSALAQM